MCMSTAELACVLFHFWGDISIHLTAALPELIWTGNENQITLCRRTQKKNANGINVLGLVFIFGIHSMLLLSSMCFQLRQEQER